MRGPYADIRDPARRVTTLGASVSNANTTYGLLTARLMLPHFVAHSHESFTGIRLEG
jgi:hypothetical protein